MTDPWLTDSQLARGHHAGMVRHYARAVRHARMEAADSAAIDGLLDELRHHRRRHRAFNRHVWSLQPPAAVESLG